MKRIKYFDDSPKITHDLKPVSQCSLCDVISFEHKELCHIRKKRPEMCRFEKIFD